jgi:hypothetical protein
MKDAGGVRGKDDEHVSGPVQEPAPLALPTMSGSPTSAGSYGSRYAVTKVHFIQVNMTCARIARIHARADQPPPLPNRRIGDPFVGGVGGREVQGLPPIPTKSSSCTVCLEARQHTVLDY